MCNCMLVHVGYKKPKTYEVTSSRKYIGKAVARGRRQSVAIECLKEHSTKRQLLKRIGMLVRNELIVLCSECQLHPTPTVGVRAEGVHLEEAPVRTGK